MESDAAIFEVLAAFPGSPNPTQVDRVTAGGFSGACVWRLETAGGPLCLRKWPPEHPTRERLEFIQAVLWHVRRRGFGRAPAPLETRGRTGYVLHGGRFWELTPWLPGRADYRAFPSRARLRAALGALASFHLAAATFPLPGQNAAPDMGPGPLKGTSPGLVERSRRLAWLLAGGCDSLRGAVRVTDWPALAPRARRLLRLFWAAARPVDQLLSDTRRLPAPIQPAIRDIWREHVLFEGDEVSGIVDFGAMRPESVAADIARLLGSLVGDDTAGWEAGLAAYESVRALSSAERQLVTAFDRSAVLLGGMQWLSWIYADGRIFADRPAVEGRLDEILERLEHLAGRSG